MPVFLYTASDSTGSITKGEIEGRNKAAASRKLSSQGLFVLEIKQGAAKSTPAASSTSSSPPTKRPSPSSGSSSPPRATARRSSPPPPSSRRSSSARPNRLVSRSSDPAQEPDSSPLAGLGQILKRRSRWPAMQQALYLRQLNVMFDAGIPIHQAASVVGDSEDHPPEVREKLCEIPRDLERGRMLSKCMERSGLFGRLVVSSVRLGEQSGRLDEVLRGLAETQEESVRLRRSIVSKLTYPIVVMIIMSLGLLVMGHVMSRVMASLPNFEPADIPLFGLVTQVFQHGAFLPACIALLLGLAGFVYYVWTTPALRMNVEQHFLVLPVVGSLLRRLEANTVTSQLSLLLSAGLTIDRGMALCAELVMTLSFREALLQAQKDLRAGGELGDCFRFSGLFPDDVLALVTAGEISGQMEDSLQRAAEYCSDQVERTLETLLALLEPLLIGFLGIAIGSILLCTFVPVFNSLQTL